MRTNVYHPIIHYLAEIMEFLRLNIQNTNLNAEKWANLIRKISAQIQALDGMKNLEKLRLAATLDCKRFQAWRSSSGRVSFFSFFLWVISNTVSVCYGSRSQPEGLDSPMGYQAKSEKSKDTWRGWERKNMFNSATQCYVYLSFLLKFWLFLLVKCWILQPLQAFIKSIKWSKRNKLLTNLKCCRIKDFNIFHLKNAIHSFLQMMGDFQEQSDIPCL